MFPRKHFLESTLSFASKVHHPVHWPIEEGRSFSKQATPAIALGESGYSNIEADFHSPLHAASP